MLIDQALRVIFLFLGLFWAVLLCKAAFGEFVYQRKFHVANSLCGISGCIFHIAGYEVIGLVLAFLSLALVLIAFKISNKWINIERDNYQKELELRLKTKEKQSEKEGL